MADELDTATVRAAAAAIAATLKAALEHPDRRLVMLTRDEALLAQGILEGVVEQIDRSNG